MANKLEKNQQKQIEILDEGLFAPIWKKIFSGRLKTQLKKFEKDPALRDALKRLDKSLEDFERELEIGSKLAQKYYDDQGKDDKALSRSEKDAIKYYKSIGLW